MDEPSEEFITCFERLHINKCTMDITLAENYLKEHNNKFHSLPRFNEPVSGGEIKNDGYHNKIYCNEEVTPRDDGVINLDSFEEGTEDRLNKLADIIEENAGLFAQLDYLIRGVPQEDVKKYDVKLLCSYLRSNMFCESLTAAMHNKRPLCTLALAADNLKEDKMFFITAQENTAVISTLFVELCKKVGYTTRVNLEIRKTEEYDMDIELKTTGTVAAISEHCDIDSAVDILLSATTSYVYPWRLRRIIVQENTKDCFIRTLENKVDVKNTKYLNPEDIKQSVTEITNKLDSVMINIEIKHDLNFLNKASDVFIYKGKIILLNYVGNVSDIPLYYPIILVETYRTSKELLSLLAKYKPQYLSLWCNTISTANEIAFFTDTPNIWLNNYGDFTGPGGIAETFYKRNDYEIRSIRLRNTQENDVSKNKVNKAIIELSNIWKKWKVMSVKERKTVLIDTIQSSNVKNQDYLEDIETYLQVINECDGGEHPSLTCENGKICQYFKKPLGTIAYYGSDLFNTYYFSDILTALMYGNGILCNIVKAEQKELISHMTAKNIPITNALLPDEDILVLYYAHKHKDIHYVNPIYNLLVFYEPKTIWSYYGETFAN